MVTTSPTASPFSLVTTLNTEPALLVWHLRQANQHLLLTLLVMVEKSKLLTLLGQQVFLNRKKYFFFQCETKKPLKINKYKTSRVPYFVKDL
jgi:hypothetical protein